jgi:hypothetical protein
MAFVFASVATHALEILGVFVIAKYEQSTEESAEADAPGQGKFGNGDYDSRFSCN